VYQLLVIYNNLRYTTYTVLVIPAVQVYHLRWSIQVSGTVTNQNI